MGIADSPLRGRVIFVEGMPRSGTTALISMLAVHPEIAAIVTESRLFSRGVDAIFDNYAGNDRYDTHLSGFVSEAEIADLVRDLGDGVLTAMRARTKPGAGWVAEKSPAPRNDPRRAFEHKLRTYPDAHYVEVRRDREETVASLLKAPWNSDDAEGCRRWWEEATTAAGEVLGSHPRLITVEYAELAAEPVTTVTSVLDSIGIESGEGTRSAIEAISRERLSTFRPQESAPPPAGIGSRVADGARAIAGRARDLAPSPPAGPEARCSDLVAAIRSGDERALAALTSERLLLELRSGSGDLRAQGADARKALLGLRDSLLAGDLIQESWTTVAEPPLVVLMLAAIRGNGSRIDASFGMLLEGEQVVQVGIIAAGAPHGREPGFGDLGRAGEG